jgi:spore germination protein GerM
MRFKGILSVAIVALLAAGCGGTSGSGTSQPSTSTSTPNASTGSNTPAVPGATPTAPTATASPTVTVSPTPPVRAVRMPLKVYFLRGETLVSVQRGPVVAGTGVATAAVRSLLQGPDRAERAAGLSTIIPAGTRLNGITISNGTADVDLSAGYASGGGTLSMTARLAQVVYTVTQFPTVQRVTFRLDGTPVTAFGGEGIVLDKPVTRARFTELLPPIFVDTPARGATVRSPVRMSGVADVFEGHLIVEVRAADGRVLARGSGHAAMGMYAPFSVQLSYRVARTQAGSVVAYDRSAKDGSVIDLVTVPVILSR